MYIKVNNFFFG